jgi:hypothetical protein
VLGLAAAAPCLLTLAAIATTGRTAREAARGGDRADRQPAVQMRAWRGPS